MDSAQDKLAEHIRSHQLLRRRTGATISMEAEMTALDDVKNPICEMKFIQGEGKDNIVIRLFPPINYGESGQYLCISEIEGFKGKNVEKTFGDTQFGALTLALLRFRKFFANLKGDFRNEEGNPPYVFFPKEIPWVYGSDVYDRLCKMINDEVQKIEDERTRKREAYDRGQGNT